ncbi:MAG: peptide deformylase [Alphaproteobacteria bacterium]|nr:peptide deformylase [Alphaproteobacteria bacterium]TAD90546.1 MAG: peptide deformylase [Alphaproteobacteria bacterium]
MALLPILTAPDPRLKQKAAPVTTVDADVRRLMDDMLDTMYAAPGIGLAAPQVGVSKRVLVMDVADKGAPPHPYRMVNPEIIWVSDDDMKAEEGCLSVPQHYADVVRPAEVTVRWLDETGAEREERFSGLASVCVQHEMDHLDGILFLDHLSALKRNMILRKLTKAKRSDPGAAA